MSYLPASTRTVDDASASPNLLARLDEVGRVAAFAESAIDEALLAGVSPGEVAKRTGRDRAGLHRRRDRLRASTDPT